MIKTAADQAKEGTPAIETGTLPSSRPSGDAPAVLAGRYRIERELGAGGMGRVFLAHDEKLGRRVAVKLLSGSHDEESIGRFEQEARAASALNHPNVLSVFDIGVDGALPFLVSELLEGKTLREKLESGPLPLRRALDSALQLSRGLSAAHEKGVIHRDLKPENLFVTDDGRLKILDFGIAKLAGVPKGPITQTGTVMGTVGYMSPEQVRGEHAEHTTDLFSFGAIFHEMLTGKMAFARPTAAETGHAILHEEPPPLPETVPLQARRLVERCLEKDPRERFQSARDLAFLLEGLSASGPTPVIAGPSLRGLRTPLLGLAFFALGALAARAWLSPAAKPPIHFQRLTAETAFVSSARFAPDGASVAYGLQPVVEGGFGKHDLYVERLERPRPQLILRDALIRSISAAGEMLVLVRPIDTGIGFRGTLARLPLSGGAARELVPDVDDADWMPGGTTWALARSTGNKRVLEFPAGHTVFETAGSITRVRVSPDGAHIAYFDQPVAGDDRGFVAVSDRAGHVRRLTGEWASMDGLVWSGEEIWFSAHRSSGELQIWAVTLSGALRQIEASPGRLIIEDLRPGKGALLRFQTSRSVVRVFLPDGRTVELGAGEAMSPTAIAPDGTLLLTGGGEEGPSYGAWVWHPGDADPTRLGEGIPTGFSPDGSAALVLRYGSEQHLDLVPLGTGEARALPLVAGLTYRHVLFFPDGKRLLVLAGKPGEGLQFGWQPLEGGAFHPIAAAETEGFAAALSADGSMLASSSAKGELRVTQVSSGETRTLPAPFAHPIWTPLRFSPDGRSLYVGLPTAATIPAELKIVDLASGRAERWLVPEVPHGFIGVGSFVLSGARAWAQTAGGGSEPLLFADGLR